jgi:hypothetical protein
MARTKKLPFWTSKLLEFLEGKAGEDSGWKPV